VKVQGHWTYLYRAIDKHGDTLEFYLSPTRDTAAAKRFLGKALNVLTDWEKPSVINTDKAPTYATALAELKQEGRCPADTLHRKWSVGAAPALWASPGRCRPSWTTWRWSASGPRRRSPRSRSRLVHCLTGPGCTPSCAVRA
jgi:hypothetical protein